MRPGKDAAAGEGSLAGTGGRQGQIQAAHAGNEKAVRALMGEVSAVVESMIWAVAGVDHPDRDELVQESLLDFLWALPASGPEPRLEHVAASVSLARALEARRAARPPGHAAIVLPARDRPAGGEVWAGVADALDALDELQVEALALRLVAGMSIDEIAEVTGTPAAVVRSCLRQAKDAFRGIGLGGEVAGSGAAPPPGARVAAAGRGSGVA
jgi:DNA-directed RNA polymerase specialized sigma24 family protein